MIGPIEFDISDLTFEGVHRDSEIFLRKLMILLTKKISGRTYAAFKDLLRKYNQAGLQQRIDPFLDEYFKVCPHCGQKHNQE